MEDAKFCLESKASFIEISSIASFKLFLIAWLREYSTFSDCSVVSLKSSPCPKYTQLGTIFHTKKSCCTIKLFFFFKYVLYTALSKYLKKIGGHRACLRDRRTDQFRYIKIQPKTIDLSTRLWGINKCGVYSPEPRAEVYCFRLNFNLSNLVYLFRYRA